MSEAPLLLGLALLVLAYALLPGTAVLCLLRVRPPAFALHGAHPLFGAVFPYDPVVIDPGGTSLAAAVGPAGTLTYSGVVTLTDQPLSADSRHGLLLGVVSDARGAKLRVREFRLSVRPPLPVS